MKTACRGSANERKRDRQLLLLPPLRLLLLPLPPPPRHLLWFPLGPRQL
jgi:hypothetical protein